MLIVLSGLMLVEAVDQVVQILYKYQYLINQKLLLDLHLMVQQPVLILLIILLVIVM